jgi:predicted cupin superfamily sugar epimerase
LEGTVSRIDRATELITALGLCKHPEGGYYSEVFRSPMSVAPGDGRSARPALTSIYFLLPAGAVSRWHRVRSDEIWHFYEGAPLDLWLLPPEANAPDRHRLGPLDGDSQPTVVAPAGWWQAARSTGAYTLVGCTVGPGFEFQDFTLASDEAAVAARFRGGGGVLSDFL